MTSGHLIDSSVLIPLSYQAPSASGVARRRIRLVLCHVVIGEFLAGVRNPEHRRSKESAKWLTTFRRSVETVASTDRTAEQYGRLHHHTRGLGLPIPTNDLWIAATAAEHGFTLLTRDAHFQDLPGLAVELIA